MKFTSILCFFLFLSFSHPSEAGWIFVSDSDGESRTTMIQDNIIRFSAPDLKMTINVKKNVIRFEDPSAKMFWEGTPEEFSEEIRRRTREMEEKIGANIGKDAGEENPQHMEKNTDRSIRIVSDPVTANISGHKTHKFQVFFRDKKIQELWIADDIDVSGDLDVMKYGKIMRKIQSASTLNGEDFVPTSGKVIRLMKKGWPLQTIDYRSDIEARRETILSVRKKQIPEKEFFRIPNDYKRSAKLWE